MAYIDRITTDGEWGDGTLLTVASKLYRCKILVFTQGSSKPICISSNQENEACGRVLTLGYISDIPTNSPNHYVSLMSRKQATADLVTGWFL